MTTPTYSDAEQFFADVRETQKPGSARFTLHPWQRELVRRVAAGEYPSAIDVPTGAGKTFLAELHVFACAVDPHHLPRLILVAPRRLLVDTAAKKVQALVEALDSDNATELMVAVRERLRQRKQPRIDGAPPHGPVAAVAALRGGLHKAQRNTEWGREPNMCAVITTTPQIAVSTVLFNSYLFSPRSQAMYAGLFAIGARVVFDEAHLQRQAALTYRRVANMVNEGRQSPVLTVTEMTATAHAEMPDDRLSLTAADTELGADGTVPHIVKVMTAPKTVTRLDCAAADIASAITSEMKRMRDQGVGTVSAVVNTTAMARDVAANLRAEGFGNVIVLTGRLRPFDRDTVLRDHEKVLELEGDPRVDAVIATQTLEVGVDADFAGMVTMLAPGDALAQRFGRVNRAGARSQSEVVVVCPPLDGDKEDEFAYGPYTLKDLRAARSWLDERIADGGGVSPLTVSESSPPVPHPRRAVLEKLQPTEAYDLSVKCGYAPAVYDDPEFWLTDDLNQDQSTRVILRRALPANHNTKSGREALLKAFHPRDMEAWSVPTPVAERTLEKLWEHPFLRGASSVSATGNITDVTCSREKSKWKTDTPLGWSTLVLWVDGPVPVLSDHGLDPAGTETTSWVPERDVLTVEGVGSGDLYIGEQVPFPTADHVVAAQEQYPTLPVAKWWFAVKDACGNPGAWVTLAPGNEPVWALASPNAGSREDASSHTGVAVMLRDHRADVARACESLGQMVSTDPSVHETLRLAGLYHDDGKAHELFQKYLRVGKKRRHDEPVWAKSPSKVSWYPKTAAGLPPEWRHEQLSAAIAVRDLDGDPLRDVVAVLAGLSHGYGRTLFPHGYRSLVGGDQFAESSSEDIFTDGTWDEMLHRCTKKYGPWGLAWLEALVRAADHHVSEQKH